MYMCIYIYIYTCIYIYIYIYIYIGLCSAGSRPFSVGVGHSPTQEVGRAPKHPALRYRLFAWIVESISYHGMGAATPPPSLLILQRRGQGAREHLFRPAHSCFMLFLLICIDCYSIRSFVYSCCLFPQPRSRSPGIGGGAPLGNGGCPPSGPSPQR